MQVFSLVIIKAAHKKTEKKERKKSVHPSTPTHATQTKAIQKKKKKECAQFHLTGTHQWDRDPSRDSAHPPPQGTGR